MPSSDTQKVVLVTGTSSGFGLLIAARLAASGHFVYATMRDLKKQQPLLDEASNRGAQVFVRQLDVTRPQMITDVLKEIQERHNHIDAVVNNAGFVLGGFFEDLAEGQIREQMEVNFFGVQNVCRQLVPLMRRRRKGWIINISSVAGLTATPALGAYNASKWALEGFSESLYHEMKPFGVHVVIIEPGSYPTEIFAGNKRVGKNSNDPQSPYFEFSRRIAGFVDRFVVKSPKDPEHIAVMIERILSSSRPKLRYISDFSSWLRVFVSRLMPPPVYNYIFRRLIYANSKYPV